MRIEALERRVAALEARAHRIIPPPQSDVVVIDNLMWHKASSPDRLNFKDAEAYCKALTTAGHTDWRLPTVEELFLLADRSRFNPAIDTAAFPTCKSDWYWSSSPFASSPADYAWIVYFNGGHAHYSNRDLTAFVRAVRSVAPASQVTP